MHRNSISLLLYVVHIGSCVLLLTFGARAVSIDNVHVSQPIVRRSPDTRNPDDMFGFAAIMHQIEVVNPGDSLNDAASRTRIIVGAPSGTFPGGLDLDDPGAQREERSGLVYTCPIQPGTCDGVRGDTTRYLGVPDARDNNASLVPDQRLQTYPQSYIEGRLFDQAPNALLFNNDESVVMDLVFTLAENKTGQLLGATLFSNGETFMACAPRWTDTRLARSVLLPRGVCYVSGRNLQGFERLQPCVGRTPSTGNTRSDGYCLAGTSALVYDGGYVIGAPGNEEGRGSLFYSTSSNSDTFMSGQNRLPNADGMSDDTITDQYQGFSTVAAFITQERSSSPAPNIVAAVPRYDDDTYSGRITVYNPDDYQTIQAIDARGTQMAEFFGHSMIAIDINGDNYDDLVIGAPMNTEFDALKIERGRVYVFMNTGSGALMSSDPIIFNGSNPRGRFGTSLANLGDIDRDGNEDFAVGAPYTENNGNTGAIYIYYGNSNKTAFESQTPFEITASDVVNSITNLAELKTFGYSVSGGIDVDNSQFNDLVVGAYESQLVVLFRSLPVITVFVNIRIDDPTPVALDSMFPVSVTAYYEGMGVNGQIVVPFTLSEDRSATANSRLRFGNDGEGTFTLRGPGMMDTQTIMITSLSNTTSLEPHMLRLTIPGGIDPPSMPTDGNRPLMDLSPYPRLRLAGNNTLAVPVTDPCMGDGCQFDIELTPTRQTIQVIANDNPIYTVDLMYTNSDSEDAVGLLLNFTGLSRYIRSVAIQRRGAMPAETPCTAITNGFASCILRTRFAPRSSEIVTVNFTIDQDSLTGSEPDFTVQLEVASETGNPMDEDENPSNNAVQLTFDIVARAEISVTRLSFGGTRFDYTAIAPQEPVTVQGLGRSTITLEVDIQNAGPTTIREGNVTIYLANRIMDTDYTLYPTRIEAVDNQNGAITCDSSFVNPDGLPQGASQVGEARRRRSAYHSSSSSLKRVTRQENTVTHSCIGPTVDSGTCTVIRCSLSNLRRGTVPFTISIFTRIDERYFSMQLVPGTVYSLTTSASVSIMSSFYGDNTNDNSGMVTVMLVPMVVETPGTTSGSLLHSILWPCIGGVLLLIAAAILLYFVGFFRRKKKPDEGEAEGDFDVDQYNLKEKPDGGKEPSAPVEGGKPDTSSEITKV